MHEEIKSLSNEQFMRRLGNIENMDNDNMMKNEMLNETIENLQNENNKLKNELKQLEIKSKEDEEKIEDIENKNNEIIKRAKEYLNTYKVLKPIILALKTLLKNGNLNDPYKGGLSSYGLILMVVSFIQSEIDNEKYKEKSPTIIGETFLNVLGHYGIFFDYNNYVIITYPVNEKGDGGDKDNTYQFIPNTHELIIVDPLNKQNNVAKSNFQFMNIKMGFFSFIYSI